MIKKIHKILKYILNYMRDFFTSIFDKRMRFCVYGTTENETWTRDDYYFRKFLPFDDSLIKFSYFNPSIKFFQPFINIQQYRILTKNKRSAISFFTGECVHSPLVVPSIYKNFENHALDKANISFGFDYLNDKNYIRYPLWILFFFQPTKNKDDIYKKVQEFNNRSFEKTKFCSLIASHDITGIRTTLLDLLSPIETVACPGKFMQNDVTLKTEYHDNKYEYLKQFKFNLCPENFSYSGYVTEKIFQSFWSDCIPIYHGYDNNPEPEVINPKSFIFLDPDNPNDTVEKITELHTNSKAFIDFKKEVKLHEGAVDYIFNTMDSTYNAFETICKEKGFGIKK